MSTIFQMSAQLRRSGRKRTATPALKSMSESRPMAKKAAPRATATAATQPTNIYTSMEEYQTPVISNTTLGQYASIASPTYVLTTAGNVTAASTDTQSSGQPDPTGNQNVLGNARAAYTTLVSSDTHMPEQIPSFQSVLAFNVPQNVRDKIHKSEYIDLAVLLSNCPQQSSQKLVFKGGEFIIQPETPNQKINSIELWTTAFISFTSIFCTIHTTRFQELLKYMSDVRLGAYRGANWKQYDEQYRLRKALNPLSSWAEVDVELWLIYMSGHVESSPRNAFTANYSQNKKLRCYSYNYDGQCFKTLCQYSHTCLYCNGGHPVRNCPNKPVGGSNQRFQTTATRAPLIPRLNNYNSTFRQNTYRSRTPGTFMGPRSYTNTH